MKRISTKSLKLGAGIGLTMFSLVAAFSATMAWFGFETEASGTGIGIEVDPLVGRLNKVYFHAMNSYDTENNAYKYVKSPFATYTYNWSTGAMDKTTSDPQWVIGQYDSLLSYNKYNSMLMVFELNDEYTTTSAGDIYIKGSTTVGGFLGARQQDGSPVYDLSDLPEVNSEENPDSILMRQDTVTVGAEEKTVDYFAFSSVARFSFNTYTDDQYETLTSGATLDIASSSLTVGGAFTTINNVSDSSTFDQNPFLYESGTGETFKYIAMVISYSPDAVGYIYSTYLGDDYMNTCDSILHFACDWSLEVH